MGTGNGLFLFPLSSLGLLLSFSSCLLFLPFYNRMLVSLHSLWNKRWRLGLHSYMSIYLHDVSILVLYGLGMNLTPSPFGYHKMRLAGIQDRMYPLWSMLFESIVNWRLTLPDVEICEHGGALGLHRSLYPICMMQHALTASYICLLAWICNCAE